MGALASVIIGAVNFLILLTMSDNDFDKRYNKEAWAEARRKKGYDVPPKNAEARTRMNPTPPQYRQEPRTQFSKTPPPGMQKNGKTADLTTKEGYKAQALTHYRQFDYEAAILAFNQALAIDLHDKAVHWNLACCYSLTEQKELAYFHLQRAVEEGFRDYDKIKEHDALAYLRIQPDFETFARNGFKMPESMDYSHILVELKALSDKRAQGQVSEREFRMSLAALREQYKNT